MAHFPSFCGTDGDTAALSKTYAQICAKELGTLFAHITYETNCNDGTSPYPTHKQGLCFIKEKNCDKAGVKQDNTCDYTNTNPDAATPNTFMPKATKQYFGRGPL